MCETPLILYNVHTFGQQLYSTNILYKKIGRTSKGEKQVTHYTLFCHYTYIVTSNYYMHFILQIRIYYYMQKHVLHVDESDKK